MQTEIETREHVNQSDRKKDWRLSDLQNERETQLLHYFTCHVISPNTA